MRNLFFSLLMCVVLGLGGCKLAPKYTRPEAPVPGDWPKGAAYQEIKVPAGVTAVPDLKWEEFFADENLRKVIAAALDNNRDLKLAALNVEHARALYGIQRAELFPAVDITGSGIRHRVPADLSRTGSAVTDEEYSVNFGISSWEIDFFGRIRSLKDRALEEYLATEQAGRSARLLIITAVANAYLTLAADRENLKLAESTLENQSNIYNLIKRRYEVGLASELDLRRAQSQVDAARADVARYTQQTALDANALNLLVGSPAPPELLPNELDNSAALKEISAGTSSEILLRRPDILAAEHRLKAFNANIGAARAAFFPRIALTTSLGTASSELSGLFKSGSYTWNFAPRIVVPIFDARTWSAYDAAKVERKIALTEYEKAIQTAFREVADALAVQGTVDQQLTAQQSLVFATSETYRLSNTRYMKGIDSYLSVLDAQRSLYTAQQGLITLRLARLTSQVTLYKVLGGGA